MARDLAKLDEPAMFALGFDRVTVKAFTQILEAVQGTLPEVVAESGSTVVTLSSLQLVVDGTIARLSMAEAELDDAPPPPDAALLRRLAELEARTDAVLIDYNKLSCRVAELENGVN